MRLWLENWEGAMPECERGNPKPRLLVRILERKRSPEGDPWLSCAPPEAPVVGFRVLPLDRLYLE